MPKRVYIINFSAPEIQIAVLIDNQLQDINLRLPWEVGFRQESDDTLAACFGQAFKRLNSNHPAEVRFRYLDVKLKDITDKKTLQHLFQAFFEEIFHHQLPKHGYPIDAMAVYAITPYQWRPTHRQQLRWALKGIKSDGQIALLKPSSVTLRGVLSQILCLSAYYQKAWMDIPTDANNCHLLLIDFARNDFVIYQMICSQLEDNITVELTDALRFTDYFSETEKKIAGVQKALQKVEDEQHVVVGFSGSIDDDVALTIIESLRAGCNKHDRPNRGVSKFAATIIESLPGRRRPTFLEPQATATLLGGAELVRQFEEKSVESPLHFVYHFCYGVRLPDGKWVELVPKTWTPPYHRKKAFRVTGSLEKFDVQLFCSLSLTDNSDVHHVATLDIAPPENKKYTLNSPMEFILSVTLNDTTHGTFAVHFPNPQEPRSVEFAVPTLMD